VAVKEIAVKKYVVKLSLEERERLETLIRGGKHPSRKLTRARILLKADAGEAGEGWSDSQIAGALDIGLATVARVRQQLVEEGFDSVLTPKRSPASARPRIFDGASEAKLIALACSEPPKGRARWTLSLLEDKACPRALDPGVVELKIVARASDNTIGRTLKKHSPAAPERAIRHSAPCLRRGMRRPAPHLWLAWKTCWRFITDRTIRIARWSVWTRPQSN
jgi:transposase